MSKKINMVVADRLNQLIKEMNTSSDENNSRRANQQRVQDSVVAPPLPPPELTRQLPKRVYPAAARLTTNGYRNSKCSGCQKVVVDGVQVAEGVFWHRECLTCSQCQKSLGATRHFIREGEIYCPQDFSKILGSKCTGCQQEIKEHFTIINEHPWHAQCYVCSLCGKGLNIGADPEETQFYEHNGIIFCALHYRHLMESACAKCKKPILAQRGQGPSCVNLVLVAEKLKDNCFICENCRKPIGGSRYYEEETTKMKVCEQCHVLLNKVE